MIGFVPCDLKAGKMCIKIMTTPEQNKTSILIIVFFLLFLLKYGTTAVLICLLIQILRVLITILDTSNDPRALAVACFDLSQFIQHHPAGRVIVTDLKTKERVMKLMNHENAEVTKNALLCIQRLFLGAKYASFLQV
jgi:V-type H+-transporting ATPase subunit H